MKRRILSILVLALMLVSVFTLSACDQLAGVLPEDLIDKLPGNIGDGLPDDDSSKHTHDYTKVDVTAPTCKDEGYTTYTCDCGDSYTDNEIPSSEEYHNYVDDVCTVCSKTSLPYTDESYFVFTLVGTDAYSVSARDIYDLPETVVIPRTYNGLPVKAIAAGAFSHVTEALDSSYDFTSYCTVRRIVIPDTVAVIGDFAFFNCQLLERITIPDSVVSMGTAAFYYCQNMTDVILSENLLTISEMAFSYCRKLNNVVVPASVTQIHDYAFAICDSLSNITILGEIPEISMAAFARCSSLTEIIIPEGTKTLCQYAFSFTPIEKITLPKSLVTIEDYVFNNSPSLKEVVYLGTKEEWGKISIGEASLEHIKNARISCSDGVYEYNNSEGPDDSTILGDFSASKRVTITFYHTMGMTISNVLDKYVEEFNKLYPNIIVKHEQVGGYDDVREQISKEIGVGMQPNLAYCYPEHVAFYKDMCAIVTLDQFISSTITVTRADGSTEMIGLTDAEKAALIDAFFNEGSIYGDEYTYTMPMSKSTELLYYNKDFFEAHNLKVPTTWEEMEEVCRRIKEIDPSCIPLGYDSEANWFINLCAQYGSDYTSATGEHYLFNNETNRGFAKMLNGWYNDGLFITQELYGGYTSGMFIGDDEVRCYMIIANSAGARYNRPRDGSFEVGIAPIPQVDPSNPKVIAQGPSLCIFGESKNISKEEVIASWLFVKFLTTNPEFQAEFSMISGYIPVTEAVFDVPRYVEWLNRANGGANIQALATKISLEQIDSYFTSDGFVGCAHARDVVAQLLQSVLFVSDDNIDEEIKRLFEEAIEELK